VQIPIEPNLWADSTWPGFARDWSDDLGDLAGTQASCAYTDVLARSTGQDVHPLQVWPLDALGLDVRVANSVSHLSLFAANFTLRWHGFSEGG
jgi:hypothetical protein